MGALIRLFPRMMLFPLLLHAQTRLQAQAAPAAPSSRTQVGFIRLRGDSLPVWRVTRYTVANDSTTLVMDYQTALALDDTIALQAQIQGVWQYFRPTVEKADLWAAAVRAIKFEGDPSNGDPSAQQRFRAYGMVFRRDSAGQWRQVQAPEAVSARGTAAPDTLYPGGSPLGAVWRVALGQYAKGAFPTMASVMQGDGSKPVQGKWRKGRPPSGGAPRFLILHVVNRNSVIDSAWARQLVIDSVLDGFCATAEIGDCPSDYITNFLALGFPTGGQPGEVTVRVEETAYSPAYCQKESATLVLTMDKTLWFSGKDTSWTFLGHKVEGKYRARMCKPH